MERNGTRETGRPGRPDIRLDGRKTAVVGRPGSVRELLALLKISPQEALVRVDGKIRPDGFGLAGAKKVEIIRVVFGG
ncbi:Uncharacterised protein [uncultured archaeon]|nr:Uncharacterised protein [uncultured archaeon]